MREHRAFWFCFADEVDRFTEFEMFVGRFVAEKGALEDEEIAVVGQRGEVLVKTCIGRED